MWPEAAPTSEATPAPESPRVERVDLDDPRWDPYVRAAPGASFYHRAGWQRALARTFGYRPAALLATRDGRVTGALPLFSIRGFLSGRALISTPFGMKGGVVADEAESGGALLDAATAIAEREGARYVELRGGMPFEGLATKNLYATFEREIEADPDRNLARIPGKQRTSIRSGQRHGLTWRLGGRELLDTLYHLYSHSVRNLGTPVFPKSLFRNLLDEFPDETWILRVDREERPVAAVLAFVDGDRVLPHYAGALKEAYRWCVYDYMYWSLMCVAAERGLRVFDFGRSKRDTGAYHFKRHWGFTPAPLPYHYRLIRAQDIPDVSPANPRYAAAIRVWRRLPLAVTQGIGPAVVRYFP